MNDDALGEGEDPCVTLVAHLPYYRHAADALHAAGLLEAYLAPPMRARPLPGSTVPYVGKGVRYFNATRVVPGVDQLPVTNLWLAQATALAAQRAARRVDRGTALGVRARVWDAAATAHLGRARVVHVVSELAGWCAERARRRGGIVVCDVRSAHPRAQVEAVAPYLRKHGLHYRLPEEPLLGRLDRAFARADLLVCNSEYTRSTFVDQGIDPARIVDVGLGCDPTAFAPAASPPERFTVVFIGRERYGKGVFELAEAARALPATSRLWLSGDPDPVIEHALRGVRAEVRFLGPVPPNRVPALYREVSVLALPSYSEGYGLVVLEAMASGLPVIVSDRVGVAPLVRDAGAGCVVATGDADELASALTMLHADPDRCRAMGSAGLAAAAAQTWTRYGERLVDTYRSTVLPLAEARGRVRPAGQR